MTRIPASKSPVTNHPGTPGICLQWLAAEPFRIFFFSGAVWSVAGVLLWPLFYAGWLDAYPATAHARLMTESFGGAFVVGFLATAGPRMAGAPGLTTAELAWLFVLHQAGSLCHLLRWHPWGDALFAVLLLSLLAALAVRVARWRTDLPPPQMLLAATGLLCGSAGAAMLALLGTASSPESSRLAALLLYQGLLLPPVLGVGSFFFPRILGGEFNEPRTPAAIRWGAVRALAAAVLVVASFFLEAYGWRLAGGLLRTAAGAAYLLVEVRWRNAPADAPRGSLAAGLRWALALGLAGLVLAGFFPAQRVSIEHLLYIGGFGLLMLVVASRVLFGHSGELARFARRSWWVRFLVFLAVLAAATRLSTGFFPQLTVSHHLYAALTWILLVVSWLVWHRARFLKRDPD